MPDTLRSIAEIDALAAEIGPLSRTDSNALSARVAALTIREQAELALRLPAKERLELLLHAPKPMQLVRALPDGEVYLTVREVGPFDAMPLLSLASASQIVHILDLESWRGDRFDATRSGAWVALLIEAGEPTLRRFLRTADHALLLALLRDWARVTQIEIDHEEPVDGHGETEAGNESGFVSPDGAHRFSPAIPEHAQAVRRFAEAFFLEDQKRYLLALWEARMELPTDIEEDALRWRRSRLEEHGFPSRDEALAIYAPPVGGDLPMPQPLPQEPGEGPVLSGTRSPLVRLGESLVLAKAADRLSGDEREIVLFGVVALANKILVADVMDVGDPEAHKRAFEKAASYVDIALETRGARDPDAAADVVTRVPAIELFREGYARAAALSARAKRLTNEGWASRHSRALDMLDAPFRARLRGLLGPQPLYHDPELATPSAYRDFRSLGEIDETRVALEFAEVAGRLLLDTLQFPASAVESGATFSTLVITALAWHAVRGELRGDPLPADVVSDFLRGVASRKTASGEAPALALAAWLGALEDNGFVRADERRILLVFGKACLDRLASECGTLDPGVTMTPINIGCLWIATA